MVVAWEPFCCTLTCRGSGVFFCAHAYGVNAHRGCGTQCSPVCFIDGSRYLSEQHIPTSGRQLICLHSGLRRRQVSVGSGGGNRSGWPTRPTTARQRCCFNLATCSVFPVCCSCVWHGSVFVNMLPAPAPRADLRSALEMPCGALPSLPGRGPQVRVSDSMPMQRTSASTRKASRRRATCHEVFLHRLRNLLMCQTVVRRAAVLQVRVRLVAADRGGSGGQGRQADGAPKASSRSGVLSSGYAIYCIQ